MRTLLFYFLLLCFSMTFSMASASTSKIFTVVIDPGHGGVDAGATRYGLKESNIALSVSRELTQLLKKDPSFKVLMTRSKNRKVELNDRADIAHRFRGDLFLSIHANASVSKRARGVEFYIQNQLPPSEEAIYLAAKENEKNEEEGYVGLKVIKDRYKVRDTNIATILHDMTQTNQIEVSDRLALSLASAWRSFRKTKRSAIRQAPLYLTSNLQMPAVLVELGYLSNRKEAQQLGSRHYQKKMAERLYQGIRKFARK